MTPTQFNLMLWALSHAGELVGELEPMLRQHWSHPSVVQAIGGVDALAALVHDLRNTLGAGHGPAQPIS